MAASTAQAAQAGLVTAAGYDIERAWNTVDLSSLRQSLPNFIALIASVIRRFGLASSTLAGRFYLADRKAAGIGTAFHVRPAPLPPLEQIGRTISWATQPLWAPVPDVTLAQSQLTGAVDRLILDVGRQTVIDNVHRDREAKGWARIPEPGCCYFCAMLATRGAVYKADTAAFKSHNHCRCHAEPVFTSYEPTAQIREWQGLYARHARGAADPLAAFRKAFSST